jgi:hypothetical protein
MSERAPGFDAAVVVYEAAQVEPFDFEAVNVAMMRLFEKMSEPDGEDR